MGRAINKIVTHKTPPFTIHTGDCLDVMATMPDGCVDLTFTSPPYNLGNYAGSKPNWHVNDNSGMYAAGKAPLAGGYASYSDDMPFDDYVAWQKKVLLETWRLTSENGAIFFNHKPRIVKKVCTTPLTFVPEELMPYLRQIIIWDRGKGMNFNKAFFQPVTEWILILAKPGWAMDKAGGYEKDVWRVNPESGSDHPAPFPVGLPLRAIKPCGAAKVVFDPFCGSATTGVAALSLGREFVGIELDRDYSVKARLRLATVQAQ